MNSGVRCIALSLAFLCPCTGTALEYEAGVGAGVNVSGSWGEDAADIRDERVLPAAEVSVSYRPLVRFAGGAMFLAHVSSRFFIEADVVYARKGDNLHADIQAGPDAFEADSNMLDYLVRSTQIEDFVEMPLLAGVRFMPSSRVRPFVVAGVTAGVLVRARRRTRRQYNELVGSAQFKEYLKTEYPSSERTSLTDTRTGYDIGPTVGGGIEIGEGSGKVRIGLRATSGFISRLRADSGENTPDVKRFSVSLRTGYRTRF